MATLKPNTQVCLRDGVRAILAFPPPDTGTLAVAVHSDALRAGSASHQTSVACLDHGNRITWIAGLDEGLLHAGSAEISDVRSLISDRLLIGSSLFQVVRPGHLISDEARRPHRTVYDGDRPWVVLGALDGGELIAAPLNSELGGQKWFTPMIAEADLDFRNSKASILELAHLWSFPGDALVIGKVTPNASAKVCKVVERYFT